MESIPESSIFPERNIVGDMSIAVEFAIALYTGREY